MYAQLPLESALNVKFQYTAFKLRMRDSQFLTPLFMFRFVARVISQLCPVRANVELFQVLMHRIRIYKLKPPLSS